LKQYVTPEIIDLIARWRMSIADEIKAGRGSMHIAASQESRERFVARVRFLEGLLAAIDTFEVALGLPRPPTRRKTR
jgi:hypothetical protein